MVLAMLMLLTVGCLKNADGTSFYLDDARFTLYRMTVARSNGLVQIFGISFSQQRHLLSTPDIILCYCCFIVTGIRILFLLFDNFLVFFYTGYNNLKKHKPSRAAALLMYYAYIRISYFYLV